MPGGAAGSPALLGWPAPVGRRRAARRRENPVEVSVPRGTVDGMAETTDTGPARGRRPHPPGERLTLRGFWGALPTAGRWLLSTTAISTLGRGMTLPFTIIYIHEVRGVALDVAGLLMGLIAVVALLVTVPVGVAHRPARGARRRHLGQRRPAARRPRLAFATTVPAFALAVVAPRHQLRRGLAGVQRHDLEHRQRAGCAPSTSASTSPWSTSASGSAGSSAASSPTSTGPGTFTAIFLADAVVHARPVTLLLGPLRHVAGRPERHDDGGARRCAGVGYLAILRNPAVRWITRLTFLASFVGYGQMEAGFPAFARAGQRGVDPHDRSGLRRQHRRHRRLPVPRAAAHRRPPSHPGLPRPRRPVGRRLAAPGRDRPRGGHRLGRGRRHRVPRPVRPRRDDAPAHGARHRQRPRQRPRPRAASTPSRPGRSRSGPSPPRSSPGWMLDRDLGGAFIGAHRRAASRSWRCSRSRSSAGSPRRSTASSRGQPTTQPGDLHAVLGRDDAHLHPVARSVPPRIVADAAVERVGRREAVRALHGERLARV